MFRDARQVTQPISNRTGIVDVERHEPSYLVRKGTFGAVLVTIYAEIVIMVRRPEQSVNVKLCEVQRNSEKH